MTFHSTKLKLAAKPTDGCSEREMYTYSPPERGMAMLKITYTVPSTSDGTIASRIASGMLAPGNVNGTATMTDAAATRLTSRTLPASALLPEISRVSPDERRTNT